MMPENLESIWINVELKLGVSVPATAIPQMIEFANRMRCVIKAKANGVTIIACPGDNPLDLAISWEEVSRDPVNKIATAEHGRKCLLQAAGADR